MKDIRKLFAGAPLAIASSVIFLAPASGLSAELKDTTPETLSIGLPPQGADDFNDWSIAINNKHNRDDPVMEYNIGQFSLRGGRVDPAVGISWDPTQSSGTPGAAPGGLSLSATIKFAPDRLGHHRLTGGTSFLDTSLLSRNHASFGHDDTIDTPSGRVPGAPDSSTFNLVLQGGQFPVAPDLSYRIGYIRRATDANAANDESGFTAGIANRFNLGTGLSFTPSIEAARLTDSEAIDRDYFAASMLTEWRNWNLALSYSRHDADNPATDLIDDYEAGASIGYVFDSGVTADIGWGRQKQAEEIADHIGFHFKYRIGFGQ